MRPAPTGRHPCRKRVASTWRALHRKRSGSQRLGVPHAPTWPRRPPRRAVGGFWNVPRRPSTYSSRVRSSAKRTRSSAIPRCPGHHQHEYRHASAWTFPSSMWKTTMARWTRAASGAKRFLEVFERKGPSLANDCDKDSSPRSAAPSARGTRTSHRPPERVRSRVAKTDAKCRAHPQGGVGARAACAPSALPGAPCAARRAVCLQCTRCCRAATCGASARTWGARLFIRWTG